MPRLSYEEKFATKHLRCMGTPLCFSFILTKGVVFVESCLLPWTM